MKGISLIRIHCPTDKPDYGLKKKQDPYPTRQKYIIFLFYKNGDDFK